MSKDDMQHALVPKLRFPEFRNTQAWVQQPLGALVAPITERVGNSDCIPYTVTSGEGLISQEEKYGRTIAGKSLSNYYRLQRDDFAFNKSATKRFPQGYIVRFRGHERAAVPNSIFTCFRIVDENVDAAYLDYLFQANLHGRWLKDYITVGARAHGALNISDNDLYAMPVPLPVGDRALAEQRKIAACLGSLDDLIAAERRKLSALRQHKNGLMQQLFPCEGEACPLLRFPEFQDAPEWSLKPFDRLFEFKPTNTYPRNQLNYRMGDIRNIHYGDIHTKFHAQFYIDREEVPFVNTSALPENINPHAFCKEGDMVFVDASEDLADVGKSVELVDLNNEQVLAGSHTILARRRDDTLIIGFGAYLFKSRHARAQIEKEAQGTKVMAISPSRLAGITVCFPEDKREQQRIVDCLASLDAIIAARARKLKVLRAHKRGLMQQLFSCPEEPTE